MNTHIPTTQELSRKPTRELRAMFRDAASVAASSPHSAPERDAARQTLMNITRCLAAKSVRP